MAYTEPVIFTKTGQYGCQPKGEDDVYTIEEFKERCDCHMFVDSDGVGHPVKDRMADPTIYIWPSELQNIPVEATHIVWYNK